MSIPVKKNFQQKSINKINELLIYLVPVYKESKLATIIMERHYLIYGPITLAQMS